MLSVQCTYICPLIYPVFLVLVRSFRNGTCRRVELWSKPIKTIEQTNGVKSIFRFLLDQIAWLKVIRYIIHSQTRRVHGIIGLLVHSNCTIMYKPTFASPSKYEQYTYRSVYLMLSNAKNRNILK